MEESTMEITVTSQSLLIGADEDERKKQIELKRLIEDNEQLQQVSHELKMNQAYYQMTVSECESDRERLSSEVAQIKADEELRFEMKRQESLIPFKEELAVLQSEFDDKKESSAKVNDELELRISQLKVSTTVENGDDFNEFREKKLKLIQLNSDLLHEINDKNQELKDYAQNNCTMQTNIKELTNILEQTDEALQEIKSSLAAAKEESLGWKNEIVLLEAEMNQTKAKPLAKESRGNSMFSVLEDKKSSCTVKVALAKKKYAEDVKKIAIISDEYKKLKAENIRCMEKAVNIINVVVKSEEYKDNKVLSRELDTKYGDLINDLKVPFIVDESDPAFDFINFNINKCQNELDQAFATFEESSFDCLKTADDLYALKLEVIDCRRHLTVEKVKRRKLPGQPNQ